MKNWNWHSANQSSRKWTDFFSVFSRCCSYVWIKEWKSSIDLSNCRQLRWKRKITVFDCHFRLYWSMSRHLNKHYTIKIRNHHLQSLVNRETDEGRWFSSHIDRSNEFTSFLIHSTNTSKMNAKKTFHLKSKNTDAKLIDDAREFHSMVLRTDQYLISRLIHV